MMIDSRLAGRGDGVTPWLAVAASAGVLGGVIPLFVGAMGDSYLKLAALPAAIGRACSSTRLDLHASLGSGTTTRVRSSAPM